MSCLRVIRQRSIARTISTPRSFSTTRPIMVKAEDLSISQGEDQDTIVQQTTQLVDEGKWQLCKEGKGIERGFKFKTFKATWDFMNQVAAECKKAKHHPEWSNVYNKTHIRWTTHDPEGLSTKDTTMAGFCDAAAEQFNEVETKPSECWLGEDGKVQAGDCCTPGKK